MKKLTSKRPYLRPLSEVLETGGEACLLHGSYSAKGDPSNPSQSFSTKRVLDDNGGSGDVEEYGTFNDLN